VRLWWGGRWYVNPLLRWRGHLTPPTPLASAPPAARPPLPETGPTSQVLVDWGSLDA